MVPSRRRPPPPRCGPLNQAPRWHCVVSSGRETFSSLPVGAVSFQWRPHAASLRQTSEAGDGEQTQQQGLLIYGERSTPAWCDAGPTNIWWKPGRDKGAQKLVNQKLWCRDTMAPNEEVKCALRRGAGNVKGAECWVAVIDWLIWWRRDKQTPGN